MKIILTCIVCFFCATNGAFAQKTTSTTTAAGVASPVADTAASPAPSLKPTGSTASSGGTVAAGGHGPDSASITAQATPPIVQHQSAASNTPVDSSVAADAAKPVPAAKVAASAVVEESEDDLILDGGEESIIAPVAAPVAVPKPQVTADSSITPATAATTDSTMPAADTIAAKKQLVLPLPSPGPAIPEIPTTPARIEKMQSINFAKNYKEYRSPKMAILLSLLLPGLGQAYAHNNLKAGIFGAVEVGLITAGAVMAYKGGQKTKAAHQYADQHYDTTRFSNYYRKLINNVPEADTAVFLMSFVSPDTFMQYAKEKNQDYYTNIGNEVSPFVQGWDDAEPEFNDDFQLINNEDGIYTVNPDSVYLVSRNGDTTHAMFGFSENRKTYQDKISNANAYYGGSSTFFALLVVNHIISAIDAGITAKGFNDRLLGKSSVWQQINIKDTYVRTPVGAAQGYALEVRF